MKPSHEYRRLSALAHRIGRVALGVSVVAIGVLWAWNRTLAELFGAPTVQFKHALAMALLVVLAGWLARTGVRLARPAPGASQP